MELFIKRIEVGTPPVEYFLVTQSNDDSTKWELNLLCVQNRRAFTGSTSERELRLKAAECPLNTFDVYLSDTLHAFGCGKIEFQEDCPSMHYVIKDKSERTMLFEWIKDVSGMKVQLGELEFHEREFDAALVDILTMSSNDMKRAKRKIQELDSDVGKKERDRLAIKSVLDETLEMKSRMEEDLLCKFTKVLNQKKAKIRELLAEIKSVKKLLMTERLKKDAAAINTTSSTSSEIPQSSKKAIKRRSENINQPGPSTSKKKAEDSLLFSSDEDDAVKPRMKTGPRNRVCRDLKTDTTENRMNSKRNPATLSTRPLEKEKVSSDTSEEIDVLFDDL